MVGRIQYLWVVWLFGGLTLPIPLADLLRPMEKLLTPAAAYNWGFCSERDLKMVSGKRYSRLHTSTPAWDLLLEYKSGSAPIAANQ